jgi:diguanylate cyclase (GGDEF)-like protein/PAS domain S-box-containing protein
MGIRLTARQLLLCYAVWMGILAAGSYAPGAVGTACVVLVYLSTGAAVLTGVARNRPARRAPWLLIAAALVAGTVGAVTDAVLSTAHNGAIPFPSLADAFYLLEYPLLVVAFGLFIVSRTRERDVRSVIDALIITVGMTMLSLIFIIAPDWTNPAASWLGRLVSVTYALGDLAILLSLARLLAPGTARGPATLLLTFGAVCGIASDVGYDLLQNPVYPHGEPLLGLGWLVCYAAGGAAALHPSMTELTDRAARRRVSDAAPGSVLVLMLASLLPSIVLLVHSSDKHDAVEGVVAVSCGVLYLLMLSRLWDVAASNRRSLARERTLRMSSVALASASTAEEVAAAVQEAASAILPSVSAHGALLTVRDGDRLRLVGGPQVLRDFPSDPLSIWLKLVHGARPQFVTIPQMAQARVDASLPDPPEDLPSEVSFEGALVCPLTLKDRPEGDPFIGLLIFFGDRRVLSPLSNTLEILSGQAALAVERVELSQQVIRQRGQALFRTLVQDASDVILIVGEDRRVRYATPSAAGIFGDVTVEGARLTDLVAVAAREDVERVLDLMLTLSGGGGESPGYLLEIERLDGGSAMIEIRWTDMRADPTVGGLVLTLRDVTEQHGLQEELEYRAYHDALTGLPNRTLFAREAQGALDAARATGRTAGVLFVDLDDFKIVNDTMGHSVGDELLVAVAARLSSAVRQSDTAARLGGDEFALLIDDAADPEAVDAFADRIVTSFGEPFSLSDSKVLATVTVGVATSQDSSDTDQLLRHADLALYAAKSAGKRRWRHYQPVLTSGMLRRRELQAALEDAVKSDAFTLVYQPIVALGSGEIAGFEALIRWQHPRWGMMLPGEFIPLAEETGLIVPLGGWVLRQALSEMVRWRRLPAAGEPSALNQAGDGPPDAEELHVSVNVSARQFRDPGFVDSVRQALQAAALPPAALLLELTESTLIGGTERIRGELAELKETGVRLAIDDFGTGYSSLSYLRDLPIDVLKIDKSFVTGISSSWRQHALVEGIVRLARTLELEVIAEGIESPVERELLVGTGCQFGQGYLLSPPVDTEIAAAMLKQSGGLVAKLPRQRRTPPQGRYLTDL